MSKIKTIEVSNIKAISHQKADFNGCTGVITGGNNKGKTTFLRALPDRLRQTKPEIILKEGEHDGFYEMLLTDGNAFRWEVTDKTKAGEKLMFITKDNIKTAVTRAIADKYFPGTFDVDKFLQDPPAKQRKALQELVGLDFTDIDKRYDEAYKDREGKNRSANEAKIKFDGMAIVPKVGEVDIKEIQARKEQERERLNKLYLDNKKKNDDARTLYNADVNAFNDKVTAWDFEQSGRKININKCVDLLDNLVSFGYKGNEVGKFIAGLPQPETICPHTKPVEPVYITEMPDDTTLQAIDKEIMAAIETNNNAARYKAWVELRDAKDKASVIANDADILVKSIEKERMDLIKSAKMPEGFGFSDDGILYNGLPFTRQQLSSSGIYIAALKLAAMTIGEVRTLHFDASFLDRKSLEEIEQWAITQDLQLLIERPDFDGGEIEYQLLTPQA